MDNLTGRLLVASPHLTDGHFLRSVILMVRHDEEGALGFIINRPTDRRLRSVVNWGAENEAIRTDDQIYAGGPVEGPLVTLHNVPGLGQPCGDGADQSSVQLEDHPAEAFGEISLSFDPAPVWLTADEDLTRILSRRTDALAKFISGYAGWGPGQLDHELETGGWLQTAMNPELVLGGNEQSWEICVQRCGREVLEVIDDDLNFDDPQRN